MQGLHVCYQRPKAMNNVAVRLHRSGTGRYDVALHMLFWSRRGAHTNPARIHIRISDTSTVRSARTRSFAHAAFEWTGTRPPIGCEAQAERAKVETRNGRSEESGS